VARLPKSIIKKYGISKKAWRVFRGRKRGRTRASPTKVKKRRKNPVARRYRRTRRRRSRQMKIPLATAAGLAAGMAEPLSLLIKGDVENAANALSLNYTGYDFKANAFNFDRLKQGLLPLVIGGLVSKLVGGRPLNLNQKLRDVPFIKI